MDDLTAFLRARLDEDEQVTRAAMWDEQAGTWTASPPRAEYERFTVVDYCDDGVVVVTPENADTDGVGCHIARHDPARVLAEVEAKRRIIDLHALEYRERPGRVFGEADDPFCVECVSEPYPCGTLRLLALPYSDHPDYRPEWRPAA